MHVMVAFIGLSINTYISISRPGVSCYTSIYKKSYLTQTATSFDSVNLSDADPGYIAAHISVNSEEVEDKTLTTPASVQSSAIW